LTVRDLNSGKIRAQDTSFIYNKDKTVLL